MLSFLDLLKTATKAGASDIFIVAGQPLSYKADGVFHAIDDKKMMPDSSKALIEEAYESAGRPMKNLNACGDDDFALSIKNLARYRISAYRQRGSYACVIRAIPFGIPDYKKLSIPENVMDVAKLEKGLVIVTGTAGSGKSTTLACIIDRINKTRSGHIITIEEPIEFLYKNDKSIISQREVELDTADYVTALRASLRQAPDVILIGEMRDYETIRTAMTAAETGHLVISTLHTLGAVNTIDRIIDIFPPEQQRQIRIQLAMVLKSVISQQLIPSTSGTVIPVFEVMNVNGAIRNMIREEKSHQMTSVIGMSGADGMINMDASLIDLYKKGEIDKDTAVRYALSLEGMIKKTEQI